MKRLLLPLAALIVAAACGSDASSGTSDTTTTTAPADVEATTTTTMPPTENAVGSYQFEALEDPIDFETDAAGLERFTYSSTGPDFTNFRLPIVLTSQAPTGAVDAQFFGGSGTWFHYVAYPGTSDPACEFGVGARSSLGERGRAALNAFRDATGYCLSRFAVGGSDVRLNPQEPTTVEVKTINEIPKVTPNDELVIITGVADYGGMETTFCDVLGMSTGAGTAVSPDVVSTIEPSLCSFLEETY